MMPAGVQIPILLLTGFLGSGKTTLLGNLLKHPQMADTAVVVNEIGAIGLDHHLVQGASESVLLLENGCICCSVRDDLLGVLGDLFWDRLYRRIPHFSRVAIETTGLAVPQRIARAILDDPLLAERFRLERVVTTVDSTCAGRQLDSHREAAAQVAAADLLLITKSDLASAAEIARLQRRLAALSPLVECEIVTQGKIAPDRLFGTKDDAPRIAMLWQSDSAEKPHEGAHDAEIGLSSLVFNRPLARDRLETTLRSIVSEHGKTLLRAKGLIELDGEDGAFVIQTVGKAMFPLQHSKGLAADSHGFLILIGSDVDIDAIRKRFEHAFPGALIAVMPG